MAHPPHFDEPAATPPPQWRESARAVAVWALRLFVTLALAGVAVWAGIMLAIFGLAGVAFAVSAAIVVIAATLWRNAMLPAAVLACALGLPAAQVALGTTRFDRSYGSLHVTPRSPADVSRSTYRRGSGPVLVDLRHFSAPNGSTTTISAQADNGQLVVALPRGRCFNLAVDYGNRGSDPATVELAREALRLGGLRSYDGGGSFGSMSISPAAQTRENEQFNVVNRLDAGNHFAFHLLAYGRTPFAGGHWTHAAPEPDAPTLNLDLRSGGQVIVRDYPTSVGPLDPGSYDQEGGSPWPTGVTPPPSPGGLRFAHRASVRTRESRARWVTWEREMLVWGKAQAIRYAGSCATRPELRDRVTIFQTQAESLRNSAGRVTQLLGGPTTLHSPIAQRPIPRPSATQLGDGLGGLITVEVDGLGEVRVVGAGAPSAAESAQAARRQRSASTGPGASDQLAASTDSDASTAPVAPTAPKGSNR